MESNIDIIVITVTYGNRWNLLKKNLLTLESIDLIKKVIVVNNGCNYDLNKKIKRFTKCFLVNLKENSGSAKGYSYGIKTYLKLKNSQKNNTNEWVLFLDDDNFIKEINKGALIKLLSTENREKQAYFCRRISRNDYYDNYQPVKYNTFLGFNFFKSKPINKIKTLELLPYSGMLLTKEIIEKIGLPNEDFYLYCDDYEYSFRLAKNKISVSLLDSCIIEDMEISWNKKEGNFAISVVTGDPLKVYYSVRNRVYFEKQCMVSNYFIFMSNAVLFILYLIYKNIKSGTRIKFKSLYALLLGLYDGLRGRLGVNKKFILK